MGDPRGSGGYSGTPLAKGIGIKVGHRVRLRHAPAVWELPGLPVGCDVAADGPRGADVTVAFCRERKALSAEAHTLVDAVADDAMLWIAWPRKATGHVSDMAENDLRDLFLPLGVVDVKVAALERTGQG